MAGKYIATGYKTNNRGDLLPSVRGTAATLKDARKLVTQIKALAVPGTCFGYPLVTLAVENGETLEQWRMGRDLEHHLVADCPDNIGDPVREAFNI